ncbi:MAG: Conserved hypothetical cupin family protein [Cyanobacteria bacterium RYN_339]|nr:Conserved hypothetical cupin family protein [Cyanobacteria bacterium RYN_339]
MKYLAAPALFLALATSASAEAGPMTITRSGSHPVQRTPAANCTGDVRFIQLAPVSSPHRSSSTSVTFARGARTAWHSHPGGQTLVVTSGTGWIQAWGEKRQEIRVGDTIWTPPGVKHWHGATATAGMTHLTIQGIVDGRVVDWNEKVSDEQYK